MIVAPMIIAVLLGIVEGATEFLPVSSTGHLIVAGHLLGYQGEEAATFEVVIQFGAILAVLWHYRKLLLTLVSGFVRPSIERRLTLNIIVAFLPAVIIGLLAHDWIKTTLFQTEVVAYALIIGGFIMLLLEWRKPVERVANVEGVTFKQSIGIGCAQVLAMIPGTSRAATTILGGYALGLSRPAATEFSFLLAIPTIIGASALDLFKSREALTHADPMMFLVGIAVSFIVALAAIRGFLRFIQSHSFTVFAWYRIVFGALLLVLLRQQII